MATPTTNCLQQQLLSLRKNPNNSDCFCSLTAHNKTQKHPFTNPAAANRNITTSLLRTRKTWPQTNEMCCTGTAVCFQRSGLYNLRSVNFASPPPHRNTHTHTFPAANPKPTSCNCLGEMNVVSEYIRSTSISYDNNVQAAWENLENVSLNTNKTTPCFHRK